MHESVPERGVEFCVAVYVDHDAGVFELLESRRADLDLVGSDRLEQERVDAVLASCDSSVELAARFVAVAPAAAEPDASVTLPDMAAACLEQKRIHLRLQIGLSSERAASRPHLKNRALGDDNALSNRRFRTLAPWKTPPPTRRSRPLEVN